MSPLDMGFCANYFVVAIRGRGVMNGYLERDKSVGSRAPITRRLLLVGGSDVQS